jgi:hypothetical protein
MSSISKPYTFTSGTKALATQVNSNFDTIYNDYASNITNANIASGAAIVDTKLATITTAGKVNVSALTGSYSYVSLTEQTSAPTTAASEGSLYTKDSGSQPELFYREESDGDEVQITYNGAVYGSNLYQVVSTLCVASSTSTTAIPDDDTIPQNTEGQEMFTLAITPTSASNKLVIEAHLNLSSSGTNNGCVALFQNADADAIAAAAWRGVAAGGSCPAARLLHVIDAAGTTASITFKVRAGDDNAGATVTLNGAGGNRLYGGVMGSGMTIYEVAP